MYGLTISFAIIVCLLLAEKLAKKEGADTKFLWGAAFWVILSGVAGARLYHVIDFWKVYSAQPLLILTTWHGGMGILGAIFGGLIGFLIYSRVSPAFVRTDQTFPYSGKDRLSPTLLWLDIVGLVLPLGQAIGRWGNYFNQELLPYAYYESAANFGLFLVLLGLKGRYSKKGALFFSYLIGYSIIRFVLEGIRVNAWEIYGLNVARIISALTIVISLWVIKKRLN
jgi:phosphatidylglycerol---prolipoprotein diacylglyceryl transferase